MIKTTDRTLRRIITFFLMITSLLLIMCIFGEGPLSIIGRVFSAEKILYLKEVKVFEADSESEARSACENEGYTFAATDLNSGTGENYVYLGYKTTEKREEALYKISLLEMNGGFQIKDYAKLNDEYQKNNYNAAQTLQMATTEFIDSYKNASPKAIDAYEGLNLLYVPDAGNMKFGDYVVQGKTNVDFYARVLTQSSSGTVSAIINLLSAGLVPYAPESADNGNGEAQEAEVWAAAMADSSLWDLVGSGNLSQDSTDELDRTYADDAKALFKQMQEFATNFENSRSTYNEQELKKEASQSDLDTIVDKMDEVRESDTGAIYIQAYNLLNQYHATSDMPLGEWIVEMGTQTTEEADLRQIYPMIDAMSYAQVKMTELTGFVSGASTLGKNEHSKEYETLLNTARNKLQSLLGNDSISIWSNSDPDMMNKKVAFTSDAIRQNAAQTLLNDQANEKNNDGGEIIETAFKWMGLVSSALTVIGFVFGEWFIGGILANIAEMACCACLSTVASTMVTISSFICTYGGYFGIAVLACTLLYLAVKAIVFAIMESRPKAYTEIPDYVIDAVKVDTGYASVKYKAVMNNRGKVADLNGYKGFTGWVCMYTSIDERVGSPIRADEKGNIFVIRYSDGNKADGCDCANFFGQITPGNCNTNMKKDGVGGIYINYYTEDSLNNRRSSPSPGTAPDDDKKSTADQAEKKNVKKYYNDIIVRTAKTAALAKSKITAEGHYILDQNLSAGAREIWETGGQYTYLGYTVTTDPKQAIRDIRVATFTPGGQIQFGEITYGCAGTLGFPATSKEEDDGYPQNLDGLFFTRQEKAGTPIEVGKLHIVGKFSDAKEGWEPVTTFSGLPYNFSTTRYNSQGGGAAKPGRWRVYPFEYTGYCTAKDHTWEETDRYLYYEPETTYTSGTKYLSGLFFAFGTDSESTAALGREVEANFTELTDKLKKFQNITVRDDINLAKSYYFKGFWNDSNQKYLYLCYTWSYNPYRAIYGIAAFEGVIYSPSLPYTIQKAISYQSTPSGAPEKTMSYASASVVVQRSVQHHWCVRAISPENAYMTTTGLIGQNTQVQKGYTEAPIGYFPNSQQRKKALIPTGLYVSGYVASRNPLTLDDVVLSSTAHTATDNNGTISVNVSEETTLGGTKAKGVFASVQDLQNPAETEPFNLAYPTWISDEGTKYEAGTPLYLYFRNTVVRKKYISRIFVGQSSRKDAKSDNSDILEQADKQVDLNAIVAATAVSSDEVIPINVAADPDKEWYNRVNSGSIIESEPLKDQPAAYLSVMRTDKEEEAVRGIMLYKASPDKAVPNQMHVDGAAYYCASNTSPIRMSNGNSYYLYYSYNLGVSSGGPVTFIYASGEPFESGQTTALVTDKADSSNAKAVLYGDSSLKTFIHAKYENAEHTYFNKIYAVTASDENTAKLRLLEQGCTQFCDINLNRDAGGSAVYFGFRTFMLNEKAIRLKNTPEEKEAEKASQLSQAVYDIVCTVGEPFKPEGFISQKYQIYYAPVVMVDRKDKTKIMGVNLNEGTTGPEIYMYYSTPYAAKEYNQRVKSDPKAILATMPDVAFSSPLTKFAFTCYDRVPYIEKMEATTSDSQNILRWEYVMQANSKSHIDLNEGAIWFDSDYRAPDNRISMFAQREDGSVKPSAEITGGYVDETEDIGYIKMVK